MLDQVALFTGLSEPELQMLQSHARPKRYRKNTILIEKGDEASGLYILVRGKVRVYVAGNDGREMVLRVYNEPGTHFGELAILGSTARTASVETLEDSEFLVIARQDFSACVRDNPQIAMAIIAHLVEQVVQLTERLGSFALNDVYGRLSAVLADLAQQEDGRLITPRVTQQELAQMVGASREMVSRIFKELRAGGYIDIDGRRIVLNKKLPARW